uniref:Hyaluronidase n=1 Tax=Geotrypetes seraphini TaxID=260995 RepID=A0A6P8PLR0_GEOSA|nr:hyaluronidase-4-like isoform X2 [Geotrypetes seraphini]
MNTTMKPELKKPSCAIEHTDVDRTTAKRGAGFRRNDPNTRSPTSGTRNKNEEKPVRLRALSFRTYHQRPCHLFLLFVLLLGNGLTRCYGLKPSIPSFLPNKPFVVFWNAPTIRCESVYGVPLNLNAFSIVHNTQEKFIGENITIFYYDQLGLYPYYMNSTVINGGCPQNASLKSHLDQMVVDIKTAMPQPFLGLAVIDWEEWRPQWVRNWDKKSIYRVMSQQLVRNKNPFWTADQIDKQAQWEFETATQIFMTRTMKQAQFQQPAGHWGYYLYPECYNYDYQNNFDNFTGHCPHIEVQRNNQLQWLWEASKALYPSIYMQEVLKNSNQGKKFVKAKVIEAMRIAELPSSVCSLPVYVYSRPFYSYSLTPLTQSNCLIVQKYLKTTLGPYIINVTTAAKLCSQFICNNHGRCLRKNPDLDTYLHLNSDSFKIQVAQMDSRSYVSVRGSMNQYQKEKMKEEFTCHCYEGWTGDNCQSKAGTECKSFSKGLRLAWQWDWCMVTAISCGLLFLGQL